MTNVLRLVYRPSPQSVAHYSVRFEQQGHHPLLFRAYKTAAACRSAARKLVVRPASLGEGQYVRAAMEGATIIDELGEN